MSQFTRCSTSKYKFGAHISTAGGISKSVTNAFNIGCNAFAMFLKSPRKWVSPSYSQEEIDLFKKNCKELGYNPLTDILPHGQYFINLANPEPEKAEKSYDSFLDDLRRCEQLGIGLYNFHPGSSLKADHDTQLKQLASYINKAHTETGFVKIVLENMAGTGTLVGSDLSDLGKVIEMVEDKSRVGVCIDTCHTFAAGYDIGTREAFDEFWKNFDDIIGFKYLSAVHLNDSKAPLAANRDLHEKLGEGFLGLEVFKLVANAEFLRGIPIILETPQPEDEGYGNEIKLLEWLENYSEEKDMQEFDTKSESLHTNGTKSRNEQLAKFDKKTATKTAKKGTKRSSTSKTDIANQLRPKKARTKKE
ncbi:LANO_0D06898g1_1 [Lachancea nothofagi CBS 11611]|uniref:Apurinic-apyrimidinic endonuclease 1 n=1 Tax=Lachancea nothofagi CBS 11611 TaxID=1266666 RepID=A0A1G4JHV3_9SACH|nr:LANO_0D06898g1_1 [Lachancea nothofagi CBS 11611]